MRVAGNRLGLLDANLTGEGQGDLERKSEFTALSRCEFDFENLRVFELDGFAIGASDGEAEAAGLVAQELEALGDDVLAIGIFLY
jgi:hypothetical protein